MSMLAESAASAGDPLRKTRVLIVDDQPMVRAGISMLLAAEADLEIIGDAGSGDEAIKLSRRYSPDVVLMDVRMPGMDGVTATKRLIAETRENEDRLVRVLIMTTFDDEDIVIRALQAGASGYLLKHASPTEIAVAIRRVSAERPGLMPRLPPGSSSVCTPSARTFPTRRSCLLLVSRKCFVW